jgi:hypothetical protein
MATAVVLDKDTILGLIADMFVDAVINGSGQLVLTKQDTTTVTVGYVQDHSHMLHLTTADDHTQYAKADGVLLQRLRKEQRQIMPVQTFRLPSVSTVMVLPLGSSEPRSLMTVRIPQHGLTVRNSITTTRLVAELQN